MAQVDQLTIWCNGLNLWIQVFCPGTWKQNCVTKPVWVQQLSWEMLSSNERFCSSGVVSLCFFFNFLPRIQAKLNATGHVFWLSNPTSSFGSLPQLKWPHFFQHLPLWCQQSYWMHCCIGHVSDWWTTWKSQCVSFCWWFQAAGIEGGDWRRCSGWASHTTSFKESALWSGAAPGWDTLVMIFRSSWSHHRSDVAIGRATGSLLAPPTREIGTWSGDYKQVSSFVGAISMTGRPGFVLFCYSPCGFTSGLPRRL